MGCPDRTAVAVQSNASFTTYSAGIFKVFVRILNIPCGILKLATTAFKLRHGFHHLSPSAFYGLRTVCHQASRIRKSPGQEENPGLMVSNTMQMVN